MEIRIKLVGTQAKEGDASDTTNTYAVIDNGREFRITFRTYRHGCNLGIAGQEGILYTDMEANTVHRHVVSIGPACGVSVKVDEVVEGLSAWAVRGVTIAERSGQTGEIVLAGAAEGHPGPPSMSVDGRAIDMGRYL